MGNCCVFYEILNNMNNDENNTSVDHDLLRRFIDGQCSAAEQHKVKHLLTFANWQQALEEVVAEDFKTFKHTPYPEAANQSWNRLFRKQYIGAPKPGNVRQMRWIGYAAACLLMVGMFWYFGAGRGSQHVRPQMAMVQKANPRGQRSVVTLPDGTLVYLGAQSSIRYPQQFVTHNREISLRGEAYFEVAHNKQHPFIIHTGDITTRVLGTTFRVDAFKNVIVSVTSGKVRVARLNGAGAVDLLPGRQINWNLQTGKAGLSDIDIEETKAWKDGRVAFAGAPLSDIAATLERLYNVEIKFEDEQTAKAGLYIVINSTQPIDHWLDIICSTMHLKYTLKGRAIFIKH